MKKLLPIIVILIAAIGGGGGGYFFKLQASQGNEEEYAAAEGEHGEAAADDHDGEKDTEESGGYGKEATTDAVYMRFSRQFVVPVVENGQPRVMIIMDINIVVDDDLGETIYAYEPRLRDALLSHLIMKAGQGVLPQMLEDTAMMDETKAELLEISRAIIGEGALDVLIQDVGIQNY